jgi:hypothetical protein
MSAFNKRHYVPTCYMPFQFGLILKMSQHLNLRSAQTALSQPLWRMTLNWLYDLRVTSFDTTDWHHCGFAVRVHASYFIGPSSIPVKWFMFPSIQCYYFHLSKRKEAKCSAVRSILKCGLCHLTGARCIVLCWGTPTSRKGMGSIPDVIGFFNLHNPSSHTIVLESTQSLTEKSTRNLPGGKGRPARKLENFIAICEPIGWKMWEPRRLTTLWASTVYYRDSFT